MKIEIGKIKKIYEDCAMKGCKEKHMFGSSSTYTNITTKFAPFKKITATDYLKIMKENYGSCTNPGNPYVLVQNWLETGVLMNGCGLQDDIRRNIEPV